MQFITNGPHIPERLLQAHEDGKVVFFCGAGISYPARLPGFKGLTEELYCKLKEEPKPVEQAAIKREKYDTAIGLLEGRIVGGREAVREHLPTILNPDFSAPGATATHEALLTLAYNRQSRLRLITTNFDRLFQKVIKKKDLSVSVSKAPLLPVPKNRWEGLVYLHGLLPDDPDQVDLDQLVVSSGDFGLAYLTEAWAARFVGELFRNFTICFVGYSINDPVLRYMTDALAADRLLGESPSEMFAFGSFSKGKKKEQESEWEAKNVTPILYREHCRHRYLHKTLRAWSETYRDGLHGKEPFVFRFAGASPLASTEQDDFVGRMLWALSDPSGAPAKRFANLDPVPSIDWLEPLSENRYQYADLDRFGVTPKATKDDKLSFSFLRRPISYELAPEMTLAGPASSGQLDKVMYHLAHWLTRHLNDPKLVLWIAKQGGQLHDRFRWLIEHRIEDLDKLERDGKHQELDGIRKAAPNAIPDPSMRNLWRIALSGRLKSTTRELGLYYWRNRFKQDGLTSSLRMELREILTPRVVIRKQFHWQPQQTETNEPQFDWEIVLSADHVHSELRELQGNPKWGTGLPDLLSDFSLLLRDALDLMRELGGAKDRGDRSYIHQPSISRHSQNRHLRDWTALIELTRDAWLATAKLDPMRARLTAEGWRRTPYPLFKRLAFFAAAQDDVISADQALDWLIGDDNWWLWSVETKREAIRLLVALATRLSVADMARLEHAVLQGPPRETFNDDMEEDKWRRIVDRGVWLRLAKARDAGATLGETTQTRLDDLTQQYPDWRLTPDQRDEFPFWMDVRERDAREEDGLVTTPRRRRELVEWLKQNPSTRPMQEDDWQQRCRDSFPTTACALLALAQDGEWPHRRWGTALQAWADDTILRRSWRYMARSIADAPDDFIHEIAYDLSWWLREQAQTFEGQETLFFSLIRRILEMECQGRGLAGDPVFQAINHPVGHVTEALLHWWYRRSPRDGQGLPEEIQSFFTNLCDTGIENFRHGRVLLATHVISLFRVDEHWTTEYLLPLFDWQHSEVEAHAAWQGFLGSPRLYRPLMAALKKPLLTTAEHFTQLGEYAAQYASFLTFVALDRGDTFTQKELADATRALPQDGLWHTANSLTRALEGAGEQRSQYWMNRVLPYFESIWPKSEASISPETSESLARLCVAAQEAFPEALEKLKHWLQPLDHPNMVIHELNETHLSKHFPDYALKFLDNIIHDNSLLHSDWLLSCLNAIRSTNPGLETDPKFQKLEYRCQSS